MFRVNRDVRLNTRGNQNYCTLPHAIEIEESQKCSNPNPHRQSVAKVLAQP
jgi:hypothetical protein